MSGYWLGITTNYGSHLGGAEGVGDVLGETDLDNLSLIVQGIIAAMHRAAVTARAQVVWDAILRPPKAHGTEFSSKCAQNWSFGQRNDLFVGGKVGFHNGQTWETARGIDHHVPRLFRVHCERWACRQQ